MGSLTVSLFVFSARRVLINRQLRTGEPVNEKGIVITVMDIVTEILQVLFPP